MKTRLPHVFLGAATLLFIGSTSFLHAGTVVAGDGHGGYGFACGLHPREALEQTARRKLHRVSEYSDDIRIIFETPKKGAGIIVRYHVRTDNGDLQQSVAAGGHEDDRQAYEWAVRSVRDHDGHRPEVLERWTDDEPAVEGL